MWATSDALQKLMLEKNLSAFTEPTGTFFGLPREKEDERKAIYAVGDVPYMAIFLRKRKEGSRIFHIGINSMKRGKKDTHSM